MLKKPKILVIAGPTAVGKTQYAIEAARNFNGEIVSCDSMQLYKYMDIGSAKPSAGELSAARHHLVDIIDPWEDFSVARYQKLARKAIDDIISRNKLPVVSGGTGLYLNSILYDMDFADSPKDRDYRKQLWKIAEEEGSTALHKRLSEADPAAAARIHENNTKQLVRAMERLRSGEATVKPFSAVNRKSDRYEAVTVCLTRDREELYDRINRRVEILVRQGLVDEVRSLMARGLTSDNISMKGIGYKEIIDYINGKYSLDEAVAEVQKNTRHYAKRQLTWFRRYDNIIWYNISQYGDENRAVEEFTECLRKKL